MNNQYLDINGNRMAYLQFGSGPELLIAIPGYGDRAVLFKSLKESLSAKYTVYILQLPLHGQSAWVGKRFVRNDFSEAIAQIKRKEQKGEVTLMGYSFGARIVCSLLEGMKNEVTKVYLLAPDGFNQQYIRRASWVPRRLRYLLQATLSQPFWYLGLAKTLHRIGLLNSYSLHFVERHLATAKRRNRLFLFWNSVDDFTYSEKNTGLLLEKQAIPTILILGETDTVIPTTAWKAWGLALNIVDVHILTENHRVVGAQMNELLKQLI
ncbi:MAG: pimeloyl-ACP methyl ester carboxylesterase [Patescibacteria group bacterium]|jgi:pimeloyl-ACP methyl ester carboxylesterase